MCVSLMKCDLFYINVCVKLKAVLRIKGALLKITETMYDNIINRGCWNRRRPMIAFLLLSCTQNDKVEADTAEDIPVDTAEETDTAEQDDTAQDGRYARTGCHSKYGLSRVTG